MQYRLNERALTLPGTLPSSKQRQQQDDHNDRDKNPYGDSRFENAANDSAPLRAMLISRKNSRRTTEWMERFSSVRC